MLSIRGIKAKPFDLEAMLLHKPSMVEMHCSVGDLEWMPTKRYDVPLTVHVPEFDSGELMDPASVVESKRLRAEKIYAHAAGRAAAWAPFFKGRPKVVFHPGGMMPEGEAPQGELAEYLRAIIGALDKTVKTMREVAKDDVEILIENLPATAWFFGGNWDSLIMTTGSDLSNFCIRHGIGSCLDLCHLHLGARELDEDRVAWTLMHIKHALPFVRHIHYSDAIAWECSDYVSKEGIQVGEGEMPLGRYFAALAPLFATIAGNAIYAVPEIWFGHENGGAKFVEAWKRLGEVLRPAKV